MFDADMRITGALILKSGAGQGNPAGMTEEAVRSASDKAGMTLQATVGWVKPVSSTGGKLHRPTKMI